MMNTNTEFGKSYKVANRKPSLPQIASMNGYEYVPRFTPAMLPTNKPLSLDGRLKYKYNAEPIAVNETNAEHKTIGRNLLIKYC